MKQTELTKKAKAVSDYVTSFLIGKRFRGRQCVYISQSLHSSISEFVGVISERDLTVGSYIDNIIMEHLEKHREEITELYNRALEKKTGKNLLSFHSLNQ